MPIHPGRWNRGPAKSPAAHEPRRYIRQWAAWLGWRAGLEAHGPDLGPLNIVRGRAAVELADLAPVSVEAFDDAAAALEGRVDELRARLNGDAPSDLASVRRVLREISHALCELELRAAWLGGRS